MRLLCRQGYCIDPGNLNGIRRWMNDVLLFQRRWRCVSLYVKIKGSGPWLSTVILFTACHICFGSIDKMLGDIIPFFLPLIAPFSPVLYHQCTSDSCLHPFPMHVSPHASLPCFWRGSRVTVYSSHTGLRASILDFCAPSWIPSLSL